MKLTPMSEHPFRVGDRVQMTQHALDQGLKGRGGEQGTVVAIGPTVLGVKVLRDGLKHPAGYHVGFWRKVR